MKRKFFLALLNTAAAHAQRSREGFQRLELTEGQPNILYILDAEEGYSQKRLAKRCKVKESTLTVMLRKLEEKGFIKKERIEADTGKWAYGVFLTEDGRKKAAEVNKLVDALEKKSLKGFSMEEITQLFSMLDRIAENLTEEGEYD